RSPKICQERSRALVPLRQRRRQLVAALHPRGATADREMRPRQLERRSLRNALQEEQVALAEIQRAAASVPRLERATRRLDRPAGETHCNGRVVRGLTEDGLPAEIFLGGK